MRLLHADIGEHAAQGVELGRFHEMGVEYRLVRAAGVLFLSPGGEGHDLDAALVRTAADSIFGRLPLADARSTSLSQWGDFAALSREPPPIRRWSAPALRENT
jgi:hypothetical protein